MSHISVDVATITVHVKAQTDDLRTSREETCKRVKDYFEKNVSLPRDRKVLAFVDDEDAPSLKGDPVTRGRHLPIERDICVPAYIRSLLFRYDSHSGRVETPFNNLSYVHGTTCQNKIGLTLTLAHELQHFLQHACARRIWATNTMLMNLPRRFPWQTKFRNYWDIPVEVEARVASKRVAEFLYGRDEVQGHIDSKIDKPITANDAEDWQFVRTLSADEPYDLLGATKPLVLRYKLLLKELQQERFFQEHPDFSTIDFEKENWWE